MDKKKPMLIEQIASLENARIIVEKRKNSYTIGSAFMLFLTICALSLYLVNKTTLFLIILIITAALTILVISGLIKNWSKQKALDARYRYLVDQAALIERINSKTRD